MNSITPGGPVPRNVPSLSAVSHFGLTRIESTNVALIDVWGHPGVEAVVDLDVWDRLCEAHDLVPNTARMATHCGAPAVRARVRSAPGYPPRTLSLANLVMGRKPGAQTVEYVNGDVLDCRRESLRIRRRDGKQLETKQ